MRWEHTDLQHIGLRRRKERVCPQLQLLFERARTANTRAPIEPHVTRVALPATQRRLGQRAQEGGVARDVLHQRVWVSVETVYERSWCLASEATWQL
jgi:hypothetical protein